MTPGLQGTKVNSRGKEMPHGSRLYSIAATRYGDKLDGKTTTLCVRRVRPQPAAASWHRRFRLVVAPSAGFATRRASVCCRKALVASSTAPP